MEHLRQKIKMMSVNQMCNYHTILEAYNVVKNSSSEQIKRKWSYRYENKCILRSETNNDLKVPVLPSSKCKGFTYYGAKLFNKLPCAMKETTNGNKFKHLAKAWVWNNITQANKSL